MPLAGAQGFARRVIIGDQFEPRLPRLLDLRSEENDRASGIVEQRVQPFVKQRQPMLLAGVLAAGADGFVERIVIGDRTERRDIARTEAADRIGIERRFSRGQQRHRVLRAAGALGFGIEAPDGFELRTEEIESQRFLLARWPEVEDAASRRVFARLSHGAGARIGVAREKPDQLLERDFRAHFGKEAGAGDRVARRHALHQCVDRRDDQRRPALLVALGECCKRCEPPALDVGAGRNAVIRQAIPGREMQDRQLREEEPGAFERRARARVVGGDEQHQLIETRGRFGGDIGVIAFRCAADLVPARGAGDCGQAFYQTITYRDAGAAL